MTMSPPPPPGKAPKTPKPAKPAKAAGSARSAGEPTAAREPRASREPARTVDPDKPSLLARLDDAKLRGRIAMVVGALAIPAAVFFTGASTLGAADGSGVEGVTVSSTSAGPLPSVASDALPPGDYTQICAQLEASKGAFSATADLRAVSQQLLTVDIPALVAVAPEGIRPALTNLEQSRAKAAEVLSSPADQPVTQAQREALPPDYLPSLVSLSLMVDQKCG